LLYTRIYTTRANSVRVVRVIVFLPRLPRPGTGEKQFKRRTFRKKNKFKKKTAQLDEFVFFF